MNALDLVPVAAALRFALISRVAFVDDAELRRISAAIAISGAECAHDWNQPPPLVRVVSSPTEIADDEVPMQFAASINAPGDIAYHSWLQGRPISMVLADPAQVTLQDVEDGASHELNETLPDPTCDRWVPLPSGAEIALEVCDPTQGDSRPIDLGLGAPVITSNWVKPAWFDPTSVGVSLDAKGAISTPLDVRPLGYAVILNADGSTRQIGTGPAAYKLHPAFRAGRRLAAAHARGLARRLARGAR